MGQLTAGPVVLSANGVMSSVTFRNLNQGVSSNVQRGAVFGTYHSVFRRHSLRLNVVAITSQRI
jgi:hypothetical protein